MEITDFKALIDRTRMAEAFNLQTSLSETKHDFLVTAPDTELHDIQAIVEARLEKDLPAPKRRKVWYQAADLPSFVSLTNRWKTSSAIILVRADYKDNSVSAQMRTVFNPAPAGADPKAAGHADDVVDYFFPIGDQIKVWLENNKKPMSQADFAAFLEDNGPDLAIAPAKTSELDLPSLPQGGVKFSDPAEVATVARNLQINSTESYTAANKLESGEMELSFSVQHTSTTAKGKGKVIVPPWFLIRVPAFQDDQPRFFAVRLRYRAQSGSVVFFYELWRPADVFRKTVDINAEATVKETELPLYRVKAI